MTMNEYIIESALNESPKNLSEDKLKIWNMKQVELWKKEFSKIFTSEKDMFSNFKKFAEIFDEIFNEEFSKTGKLPDNDIIIQKIKKYKKIAA